MAKPEWGQKRTCQACGARFYDLTRDPIICPKCGETHDPIALLRPRRTRAQAVVEAPAKKPAPEPVVAEAESDDVLEEDDIGVIEDDDDDEDLIEDASELGEDNDVSEVIEGVEEGEENESR